MFSKKSKKKNKIDYGAIAKELSKLSKKIVKKKATPRKKYPDSYVHVGWCLTNKELLDNPDFPQELKNIIKIDKVDKLYITAIIHIKTQWGPVNNPSFEKTKYWFNKNKNKLMEAIISGYYLNETKHNKTLILECTIDAQTCLFTLTKTSNQKPISVKKDVYSGKYGPKTEFNKKLRIPVKAYAKPQYEKIITS